MKSFLLFLYLLVPLLFASNLVKHDDSLANHHRPISGVGDLSFEESLRRLAVVVDKIDLDGNGNITEKELNDWIIFLASRYAREDASKQFKKMDIDNDGRVHWDEYKKTMYGFLTADELSGKSSITFSYQNMLRKDERRWATADEDHDNYCDALEFQAFLHPEGFEHMKDIVAKETMEDLDTDGDGYIDINEYINDMIGPNHEGPEPSWATTQRKRFYTERDIDEDGKMNQDEVREWLMPDESENIISEARRLVQDSDDNRDGVLSKDEILTHYERFVSSRVTEWGNALKVFHDEF